MDIPIVPHPEKELCDYEKLRIKNIEERQQAMAESGFFDDLLDYKVKIGLLRQAICHIYHNPPQWGHRLLLDFSCLFWQIRKCRCWCMVQLARLSRICWVIFLDIFLDDYPFIPNCS